MRPNHRATGGAPVNRNRRRRATRLVALLGVIVVFVATACVAEGAWAPATVPDPAVPGPSRSFAMEDVGCSTATTCLAAGPDGAAAYDGAWKAIAALPEPLTDVKVGCLPTGTCLVAGKTAAGARLFSWPGTAWSGDLLAGVLPSGPDSVTSLSCGSIDCALTGGYTVAGVGQGFALRYDGTTFRDLNLPSATEGRTTTAISCATASVCVVSSYLGSVNWTNILRLEDTTWTAITPARANGYITELECTTADSCTGISPETFCAKPSCYTFNRLVTWQAGGSWVQWAPPGNPFPGPIVNGLACTSPTSCLTTTYDTTSSTWSVTSFDGTTLANKEALPVGPRAFDCVADGRCVFVAYDPVRSRGDVTGGAGDDAQQPLFLHRDASGLREDRSVSGPAGPSNSRFTDVACVTSTSCVAVGWAYQGDRQRSIVGTFDGTAWTVTPAATVDDVRLESVTCTSATHCVAVGGRYEFQRVRTNVVRTFDGTTWTDVPGDFGGPGWYDRGLGEVACASPTRCVAAGDRISVSSWDGPWKLDTSEHGTYGPYSSSCLPGGPCYMVFAEVLKSFDGTTWTDVELPPKTNPDTGESYPPYVQGVGCATQGPAPRCLVAVGAFGVVDSHLLLEGGPGGWTKTLPTAENAEDTVDEISCTTNAQCVVIGAEIVPQDHVRNGGDWIPLPQRTLTEVGSLSCAPGRCLHVGSVGDPEGGDDVLGARRPAAEVYDLAAPTS